MSSDITVRDLAGMALDELQHARYGRHYAELYLMAHLKKLRLRITQI